MHITFSAAAGRAFTSRALITAASASPRQQARHGQAAVEETQHQPGIFIGFPKIGQVEYAIQRPRAHDAQRNAQQSEQSRQPRGHAPPACKDGHAAQQHKRRGAGTQPIGMRRQPQNGKGAVHRPHSPAVALAK